MKCSDYQTDKIENLDFSIDNLGVGTIDSPLDSQDLVCDDEKVCYTTNYNKLKNFLESNREIPAIEKAGPRSKIFHNPSWSKVGIVTCGGLCPGLNDVIKGLVTTLYYSYGVNKIFGIPYGYRGLNPKYGLEPTILNPDIVDTIHQLGGTILGSSRGSQPVDVMVKTLHNYGINILFCIGGDGTLKGAHAINEEIKKRDLKISVIGVPKTVDNDLRFTDRTFGFETAVYATNDIITSAHMEAKGVFNGIAIVKLMGRDSGFIAAHSSLANSVVNICLIPEIDFTLEGEDGLFKALERRFEIGKTHAVIVVAEGAGQSMFKDENDEMKDASGNVLKKDIGKFLKNEILKHFKEIGVETSVKYFDPSYYIRSVPSKGNDSIFCAQLSQMAVHAAMAGKTDMVVAHWYDEFTHVPIEMATSSRKMINPEGSLWNAVLSATRQEGYFLQSKKNKLSK